MKPAKVPPTDMKILQNTLFWGFILWLFGYGLGILFFMFLPKEHIGWFILPFGVSFMLWVLIKRIARAQQMCYFGLGLIWTVLAVALDYVFIVKLFGSTDYYKLDVYVYYAITFTLPMIVGWYKFRKK